MGISDKVIVKESNIHKRGLFATNEISAGEVVVWWNKKELSQSLYKALSPDELTYIDVQGEKIFIMGEPERFVNHSCEPNTIPGNNCDIASKKILPGEEITTDYRAFFIPGGQFQCACGSKSCRGEIRGKG